MTTTIAIPTLTTERLTLRAPLPTDFEVYAAYRASPRSVHVGGPNTRAEAFQLLCGIVGQWQLRGYGRWILADRDTDAPLGLSGIYHPEDWPEPEIAWTVFDGAEGRGLAHEAALAVRAFARDTLGWRRIVSCTAPGNTRSVALAKRLGCTHDSIFQHPEFGAMDVWLHPSDGLATDTTTDTAADTAPAPASATATGALQ